MPYGVRSRGSSAGVTSAGGGAAAPAGGAAAGAASSGPGGLVGDAPTGEEAGVAAGSGIGTDGAWAAGGPAGGVAAGAADGADGDSVMGGATGNVAAGAGAGTGTAGVAAGALLGTAAGAAGGTAGAVLGAAGARPAGADARERGVGCAATVAATHTIARHTVPPRIAYDIPPLQPNMRTSIAQQGGRLSSARFRRSPHLAHYLCDGKWRKPGIVKTSSAPLAHAPSWRGLDPVRDPRNGRAVNRRKQRI